MKKPNFKSIVVLVFFVFMIVVFYLLVISGASFSFISKPSQPQILYGEFPFRVTCEVNGEKKIIEDTIICEFDGYENHGSGGKWRKWTSRLKSGNEQIVLLKISETSELYCWYGSPNYYMGDLLFETVEAYEENRDKNFASSFISLKTIDNGKYTHRSISIEEAWKKYKLKILDVQYSTPLENTFK